MPSGMRKLVKILFVFHSHEENCFGAALTQKRVSVVLFWNIWLFFIILFETLFAVLEHLFYIFIIWNIICCFGTFILHFHYLKHYFLFWNIWLFYIFIIFWNIRPFTLFEMNNHLQYFKHAIIYNILNIQDYSIFTLFVCLCLSACLFDHLSCSAGTLLVVVYNQTFLGFLPIALCILYQTVGGPIWTLDNSNDVRFVATICEWVSEWQDDL